MGGGASSWESKIATSRESDSARRVLTFARTRFRLGVDYLAVAILFLLAPIQCLHRGSLGSKVNCRELHSLLFSLYFRKRNI